jgi:drug/metabolite transporter (DMT)-like permease
MRLKSDLILLFVAAVWGSGFVAQRFAATHELGVFFFNGGRFLLGGVILLPLARFKLKVDRKTLPLLMLAGVLLFVASGLQQWGLQTTTVGNASFITGLYVVLVPLMLGLILKTRLSWISWAAALLAAVGIFLLSVTDEFRLTPGDVLELVGALFWALHVILVDRLVKRVDVLHFSIIQFITCGVLNLLAGFILDPVGMHGFSIAWQAVLYSGAIVVGVGFTLQGVGQKHAPPVDAAIILSMEAVFGGIFGVLLLSEVLIFRQILGCGLILAAMLLAQVKIGGNTLPVSEETQNLSDIV